MLGQYQSVVATEEYAAGLRKMLARLRADYGYSDVDALLVLKDILSKVWKG